MQCPYCSSAATTGRPDRTTPGYRKFQCRHCGQGFNERAGTLYYWLQYPTDIMLVVVLWRLRSKLIPRDFAEMFLERGLVFIHEAMRDREAKLGSWVTDEYRNRRRGVVAESWCVDETCIKRDGRWCYLYRAIDRNGHLVDVRLSETRDLTAARAFFRSARAVTSMTPDRVTSDGHGSYHRAIACELGADVTHRMNQYLDNHLEQDHRSIKQRRRSMLGFKRFTSAPRLCVTHDSLRDFYPPANRPQPEGLVCATPAHAYAASFRLDESPADNLIFGRLSGQAVGLSIGLRNDRTQSTNYSRD